MINNVKGNSVRFLNKFIVVTGGTSGIGLATVKRFASEGASVILADKNGQDAESAVKELNKLVHQLH